MRISRFALLLLLWSLTASLLLAQQPVSTSTAGSASPSRDPQAPALLAQCSQAMGAVGTSATFEASGKLTSSMHSDEAGEIAIEQQGYGQMRRTVSWAEGQQIYIVNNGQAYATSNSIEVPLAPWEGSGLGPAARRLKRSLLAG
jgi:hypothetical protein